ncbi:E3 SUMO-protein ligase PIAS3 [Chironomus tepperi]|uniref:E3 SUMO-protein ligase PIAS3 n=1 Tax=Chironomus tepperi TaxID=113505 RepID=UPI00391F4543
MKRTRQSDKKDDESIKKKVEFLRVIDLHSILAVYKYPKNSRKDALQARVLQLLKGREISETQKQEIRKQVEKSFDKIQALARQRSKTPENNEISSMYQQQFNATPLTPHNVAPFITSGFPIQPDVKLKRLAFYDVLGTLLQPSTLMPASQARQQEGTYYFHLTPQQATDIAMNRDVRNPAKPEYLIQVQLRFCLLETTSEQEDCFPPNVQVKVNGKLCQLPNPIATNKPGVEPRRPPRPVNITPHVKISPTVANVIHVQWQTEFNRAFVISCYLVRKLTSDCLLQRMKTKGSKPSEYTRGLIKEKLKEDADCEIATTMLRVSLICPLGKMRMTTPCRASTCMHLQCFDASLYLQMNERKPTWNCPVCDKPALYENLVIDGYFQEVIGSQKLGLDDNEIQLHKDGEWSTLDTKEEAKEQVKSVQKVEIISDDLEVVTDDLPKSNSKSSASATGTAAKPNADTVDLTLDSDDEK